MKMGAFLAVLRLPRIFRDRTIIRPLGPRRSRRPVPAAPELTALWISIRREYFPECPDLDNYTIGWSRRRQRRTLASCEVRRRIVRVAKELKDPLFINQLPPLLYHEMCHAVLGEDVGYHRGKRAWHGPRFRALERRHPGVAELDEWIKSGGWSYAIRRARGLEQHAKKIRSPKWNPLKKIS